MRNAVRRRGARNNGTAHSAVSDFATRIGESTDDVQELDHEWVGLLHQCAIVEVHAGRWRASTALTFEHLGIDEETLTEQQRSVYDRTFQLGDLLLLPKEEKKLLDQIDGQARTRTRQLSLPTRRGAIIRAENYPIWKAEMLRLKAEYLAAGASLFARWTAVLNEHRANLADVAHENYDRLQNAWRGTAPAFRQRFGSRQAYIDAFVERVMQQIPPKRYAEKLLKFEWEVGYLPQLTAVAEEEAEATRIRDAADLAHIEATAAQRRAWADSDAIAERTRARNAALLEMERDIAAEAANAKRKTLEVIQDLQTTLHAEVYNTLVEALAILKDSKPLKAGTSRVPVGRLRTLVEYVERLKFWDDPQLEANLAEIQGLIDRDARERNTHAIERKVREVAAASKLVLLNFDEYATLRSSHKYGIPDDLEGVEALVRRGSRVELDGNALPEPAPIRRARPPRRARAAI